MLHWKQRNATFLSTCQFLIAMVEKSPLDSLLVSKTYGKSGTFNPDGLSGLCPWPGARLFSLWRNCPPAFLMSKIGSFGLFVYHPTGFREFRLKDYCPSMLTCMWQSTRNCIVLIDTLVKISMCNKSKVYLSIGFLRFTVLWLFLVEAG